MSTANIVSRRAVRQRVKGRYRVHVGCVLSRDIVWGRFRSAPDSQYRTAPELLLCPRCNHPVHEGVIVERPKIGE
jgi:hypothetical protein